MNNKGFTLIETLVAIFILTLTMGALMTLTAQGFFSVRYARNQVVANQLLQESLEYVRNTRDTAMQQSGTTWSAWQTMYAPCRSDGNGCVVDAYSGALPKESNESNFQRQESFYFYQNNSDANQATKSFYGYRESSYPASLKGVSWPSFLTTYRRRIFVDVISVDQVVVRGEITWQNGSAWKTLRQSILLTNWGVTQ